MWIERIEIERFQAMEQQIIGPLKPGMVLFLGMNGAGKTTVMEFIRWVLYGDVDSPTDRVGKDVENTKKLGAVTLSDDSGKSVCIRRSQNPSGKTKVKMLIILNDRPATQADVDELLARIDSTTFRKVFAIGLDELRQSKDNQIVRDRLASALEGTGATSLPAAVKHFEENAKKYVHTYRGTITEASRAYSQLNEANRQIAALKSEQALYDDLLAELSRLQADNQRLKLDQSELNTSLGKAQMLESAWSDWCDLQAPQAQLERQKDALDLPLSRREEYRQLKVQIDGLAAQLEERQQEIAEKQRQLQQAVEKINQPLLDQQQIVEALCQRIKSHDEQLRGIAGLTRECDAMRQQIDEELKNLGPDWNAERLKRVHIDLQLHTRLNAVNAELVSAKQGLEQRQAEQRNLEGVIENKQQDIDSRSQQLVEYEALPTSEQLNARKVQLSELNEKLLRRNSMQDQLAARPPRVAAQASPWWLLVVLIGVLLIIIGGWQLTAGQQALGIVLMLAGIGLIALALGLRPKSRSTDQPAAAASPLEEQLSALQSAITQICQQLGISEDERLSLQQALEDQAVKVNNWLALQGEIKRLEADLEQRKSQTNSQALLDADQRLQQAQTRWDQLMGELGLPEGLSLETAQHTLERIQRAQSTQLKLEQSTRELEKALAVHQQLNDELLFVQALIDTEPNAAIWDRAADLSDRLTKALSFDSERVRYESEIQRLSPSVPLTSQKIEEAKQEMADILRTFGADDEPQMEQQCERAEEARRLKSEIDKLESSLVARSGPGDARARLNEQLAEVTERLELSQRVQTLERQIAETSELVDEQNTKCGQLQEQIKRLGTDTALSEQLVVREQANQAIHEAMMKWLRPWLAHRLLTEIQASYVNEHQGPVLALASELIEQITNGRIKQLKANPVGKEIEFEAVPSDGSEPLKHSHWNQALKEQVYFAIRLGYMLNHFENQGPVPVVLDDILANCDPHHQRRLAEVVTSIAQREGHQLLFFTCHPETAELFQGSQRGEISALQVVLG